MSRLLLGRGRAAIMSRRMELTTSILLGIMVAVMVALAVAYCLPVDPEPTTVWNWDQWTRFDHARGR